MNKLPLLLLLTVFVLPLASQDARQVYAKSADSVVFLRHEIFLDPAKAPHAVLWKQFEDHYKVKILGNDLPIASGTGFFIDTEGRVLTNRHVVDAGDVAALRRQATQFLSLAIEALPAGTFSSSAKGDLKADLATLLGASSYQFSASIGNKALGPATVLSVAPDAEPDLALVQVRGFASVPLPLAPAEGVGKTLVGADVVSLGYPLGTSLDTLFKERVVTMNRGGVSAFRGTELLDLQHSAAISHGNSGGPLLTLDGLVVGVNTAGLDEAGGNSLFYAVSALRVRTFLVARGFDDLLRWNGRLSTQLEVRTPVRIVSEPSGAEVRADGKLLGETPLETTLAPGDYQLAFDRAGFEYPRGTFQVGAEAVDYRAAGQPAVKVSLGLPEGAEPTAVAVRGGEREYRFTDLSRMAVLPGHYDASVEGVLSLDGVTASFEAAGETAEADFRPLQRTAPLKIRGWVPGAQLWVDGVAWSGESSATVLLPVGVHVVKARKDLQSPLQPTRITVRPSGQSFVTWRPGPDLETQRDWYRTGAWVLGGTGGLLAVLGFALGENTMAVRSTDSYESYRNWKTGADLAAVSGVLGVIAAAFAQVYSGFLDRDSLAEWKEFNQ